MRIEPTHEQAQIIESAAQRILIEANAGAAKTTTAAMKIWRMVDQGVDPSRLCAFAFSEPGVQAYQSAFRRLGLPEAIAAKVRVGTVDQFCAARLKKFDGREPTRLTRAQQVKPFVLEAIRIAREVSDSTYPGEFSLQGSGALAVESLLDDFAYLKGTLSIARYGDDFRCDPVTANELGCEYTALAVLWQYEKARSSFTPPDGWGGKYRYHGDETYDMARHLLSSDPPWSWESHPLQLGLQGIVFDEMHDCNWAMFTVIRELLQQNPHALFMGVGDRDQVIHGKQGSDSYFMGPHLNAELGEVVRFPLSITHRFGEALARPLALFSRKAYASSPQNTTEVSLHKVTEVGDNVGIIHQLANKHASLSASASVDFAVLLRHPGASVEIEHGLIMKGTSYQTVGFTTFLQRPEIAFARMLLSIAVDHPTHFIPESLLGAKTAVWQFLGADLPVPTTAEETRNTIENALETNFKSWIFPALLKEADKAVSEVIHAALAIAASNNAQDVSAFVQALHFSAMAQKVFVSQRDIEEAIFSINSFAKVAQQYDSIHTMLGAMNAIDSQQRKRSSTHRHIRLSTIEDSKGLEFQHVFIPDCNASTFDGGTQDERNLFYVAASRAQVSLGISYRDGEASSYLKHFMPQQP